MVNSSLSLAPDHPTHATLAGLSATRVDMPLAPPMEAGDLGSFAGHRIVRQIGTGGMGLVYEAVDPRLGRSVALKVLKPRYAANARAVDRFLAEGRAAAAIANDHVVTIFHVSECDGIAYLTMELLSGCSLHDHARGQSLAPAVAVRIARETAVGLQAVHEAGLVHRDVKPENIWLDARTGRVRLLDFGLAFAPAAAAADGLLGTPAYMSPEQAQGEPVDHRTDLFSLGVVLYELLMGHRPFAGASLRDILSAIQTEPPPCPRRLKPELPVALVDLTLRLLAKDRGERPASAREVVSELACIEAAIQAAPWADGESSEPATAVDARPVVSPHSGRRYSLRAVIVLGTLLFLGIVVLDMILFPPLAEVRDPPPPAPAPVRPAAASKFVPLFAGESFQNWRPAVGTKLDAWAWTAGTGVLRGTPDEDNDHVLQTEQSYTNFELQLDYHWPDKGGHTTVVFRAGETDGKPDGLEVNIGDDDNFEEVHGREIGPLYRTGSIYQLNTTLKPFNRPIGQWNSLRLHVQNQRVRVDVNGRTATNLDLNKFADRRQELPALARKSGPIGLKVHWGVIDFANVQLRLLDD